MSKHNKPEDAVEGALEILRLSNAFRDNWPAVKLRIADRAEAMLHAYRAIAERASGRLTAEQDRVLREAIGLGDDIAKALRFEEPPLETTWDDVVVVLTDVLELIPQTLGFGEGTGPE